ncbi:MAG: TetR/AcrR family transcriptional regulator [Spirochaetota bacterium]
MAGFRETKKENRRIRIHKAAIELLEEKGFSATRMRDISEKSELAVGTLYNYYSSKHELYMQILEDELARLTTNTRKRLVKLVCTGDDLLEVLMGIINPFMQVVVDFEKKGLSDILSAMFSSKTYIERGAAMDMNLIAGLEKIIRKLQRRGLVDTSAEADIAAWNMYSVIGFNVLGYLFVPDMGVEMLDQGIRKQIKQVIEGIGVPHNRK